MPDHLHLFIAVDDELIKLPLWVKSLKNALSKQLRNNGVPSPHCRKDSSIMSSEAANRIEQNGIMFVITLSALD
jgi:hypothetical protein